VSLGGTNYARSGTKVDNQVSKMVERDKTSQPGAKTLADLSALADGTLDPKRAAEVRAQIARSPDLSERYERERHAVSALRATRSDVAPPRLRARIEAQQRFATRPRRRTVYGGALTATAAAVALAVILLLPGGTPGAPSVSQAAGLALRGPAMAAPAVAPRQPATKLNQAVQEVYFPNWAGRGWAAAGQRVDRLGGRQAVTVYYDHNGKRIAYTILSAPALKKPGVQTWWVDGTKLQSFRLDGRVVVTWQRAGHTCVLSGTGVSADVLSRLAAWKIPGLPA
jgi:anti-sigma factor RsiW